MVDKSRRSNKSFVLHKHHKQQSLRKQLKIKGPHIWRPFYNSNHAAIRQGLIHFYIRFLQKPQHNEKAGACIELAAKIIIPFSYTTS